MTRRTKIVVTACILVAVQLAIVATYLAVKRARVPSLSITAERAGGAPLAITWPSERPRIVHFWATWCPPCTKELPGLIAFAREVPGIEVIAIAVDDEWSDIAAFFGGTIPPEVVVETRGTAHRHFRVTTLPDTYLVDRDGQLVERFAGARDWSDATLRAHLRGAF